MLFPKTLPSLLSARDLMRRGTFMPNVWDSQGVLSWGRRRRDFEPRKIEVVVIDSLSGYLEILPELRKLEDSVEVVGRATSTTDAVGLVGSLEPDLIIMDVGVPPGNALALAGVIHDCLPATMIVLTSRADCNHERAMGLTSGAHAFISKSKLGHELVTMLASRFPTIFEPRNHITNSVMAEEWLPNQE
jgi:DNA-binding NarL/FixJ family response regulator